LIKNNQRGGRMTDTQKTRIIILSLLLLLLLGIVSYSGIFVEDTYKRDSISMAAQGIGQDIVNLFLVMPLLVLSLIYMLKNGKVAIFIFSGTLFYILYSFFIYCFGVYFNRLFLLYCFILGLSFYLFIIMIIELNGMHVKHWFSDKVPVRLIGNYLITIAVMFYLLWLKDTVPAILADSVPKSVSDYNLLVNPVHVLDIGIVLPGVITTAILLIRKHQLGYIFTPVIMIFIIILAAALIGMAVMLQVKNINDDLSIAGIFTILALISTFILFLFLKRLNK
jgi:hypothetical protein